jgi:predicted nucleic acid-binding Zn ribbon protein
MFDCGETVVEKVGQHRHCRSCEKAIPYKEDFCGEECETAWKGKMTSKKRQLTFFYILMVIIMIFAVALTFMG